MPGLPGTMRGDCYKLHSLATQMSSKTLRSLFSAVFFILGSALWLPNAKCQNTASSPETAVQELSGWLEQNSLEPSALAALQAESFSTTSLDKADAQAAATLLWNARSELLREQRKQEVDNREIKIGDKVMPFWFQSFGEKPTEGRRLFISMHGGGNAPAQVNDQQYENQKRLYKPDEGIYLVPRAPTNSWNLWHEAHIDDFFDRLITNMIIFEDVNPDRIYFMGYSAGGDGVYQLAPRMADRLAAASMMAGHPNETKPDSLRNIGFTIHMGAKDGAYGRNRIAGEWKTALQELQRQDPDGYSHYVELHSGRSHWMNLEDAVAVPWMSKFNRRRFPKKIVWLQDDVTHRRSYWLKVSEDSTKGRPRIVAEASNNVISIVESGVDKLTVLLHDDLVDMDKPIVIKQGDDVLFEGTAARTIAAIAESLLDRDDPGLIAYGAVAVETNSKVEAAQ